jgi:hypothetical protein
VSLGVELGAALPYEIAQGTSVRLELVFDATRLPLGERSSTVVIDSRGVGLELPVAWEVVEPRKDPGDDRPIPKPTVDLSKFAPKGPPPVLRCDRYLHEFGTVYSGERLKTSFKLRNDGEGELVLIKAGAQCHCTLPRLVLPDKEVPKRSLSKEEVYGGLKPGEEATLEVEVDTAGMSGFYKKKVQIITNDAVHSPQDLFLALTVENPIKFSPSSANFGDVRRGDRVERVVRMASRELGRFAVTGWELPDPQPFDVEFLEVKPREDEQCAFELVLRTKPHVPCGEHFGRLRLDLEHERVHAVELHYKLRVLPDVQWTFDDAASPDRLSLGVVRPGLNDVQSIRFENRNRAVPYLLKEAAVESPLGAEPFETEIVELEKGQSYEVKLKVVAPPRTKMFRGKLVLRADSPTLPELKLDFSGIWQAAPAPPPKQERSAKER